MSKVLSNAWTLVSAQSMGVTIVIPNETIVCGIRKRFVKTDFSSISLLVLATGRTGQSFDNLNLF